MNSEIRAVIRQLREHASPTTHVWANRLEKAIGKHPALGAPYGDASSRLAEMDMAQVEAPVLAAMTTAALNTLQQLGYTWQGGEQWQSPLGKPSYLSLPKADEVLAQAAHFKVISDLFDNCTTGRSERILEDLGLPTDNAHRPLAEIIEVSHEC